MICLLAAFPFPLLCSFPLSIDQTISGFQEYMSYIFRNICQRLTIVQFTLMHAEITYSDMNLH